MWIKILHNQDELNHHNQTIRPEDPKWEQRQTKNTK